MIGKVLVVLLLASWSLAAEMKLFVVELGAERAVGEYYFIGTVSAEGVLDTSFRVRNSSTSSDRLHGLNIAGPGFSFAALPALPIELAPQAAADFVVRFNPRDTGLSYSAKLNINGVPTLLQGTATFPATLAKLEGTSRTALASGGAVDFGSVERGSRTTLRFELANPAGQPLTIQRLAVSGAAFHGPAGAATPIALEPGAPVCFEVAFAPQAAGPAQGLIELDGRRFVLLGTGKEPDPPKPQIAVAPQTLRGAQQAKISVKLASVSRTSTSGELSMQFQAGVPGKTGDPAVQFPATGQRTISFTVAEGDEAARFAGRPETEFQTGTTAGSIVFTVKLGPHTEQLTMDVPNAPVVVDKARATRTPAGIEVRTTGYDTSRSATRLTFTFFDRQERAVAPGAIQVDGSQAFRQYFLTTDFGSIFTLLAVFPVRGDASQIAAVEIELLNSLGATSTGRVPIQ